MTVLQITRATIQTAELQNPHRWSLCWEALHCGTKCLLFPFPSTQHAMVMNCSVSYFCTYTATFRFICFYSAAKSISNSFLSLWQPLIDSMHLHDQPEPTWLTAELNFLCSLEHTSPSSTYSFLINMLHFVDSAKPKRTYFSAADKRVGCWKCHLHDSLPTVGLVICQ